MNKDQIKNNTNRSVGLMCLCGILAVSLIILGSIHYDLICKCQRETVGDCIINVLEAEKYNKDIDIGDKFYFESEIWGHVSRCVVLDVNTTGVIFSDIDYRYRPIDYISYDDLYKNKAFKIISPDTAAIITRSNSIKKPH